MYLASFKLVYQADNFLNFLLGFDKVLTFHFPLPLPLSELVGFAI